jgi:hypothetical protein
MGRPSRDALAHQGVLERGDGGEDVEELPADRHECVGLTPSAYFEGELGVASLRQLR